MLNIDYRLKEYKLLIDEFQTYGMLDCQYLYDAVNLIKRDPKSSLVKIRIVLETIVYEVYKVEMDKEPKRAEIGPTLGDTQFRKKLDTRIYTLMDSIRGLSNMGAHAMALNGGGTDPTSGEAIASFEQLVKVIEWYIEKYRGRVMNYGNANAKSEDTNCNYEDIDVKFRQQPINQTIINGEVSGVVNSGNGTVNIINKK